MLRRSRRWPRRNVSAREKTKGSDKIYSK